MLKYCSGPDCDRLLSISQIPGGNPYAKANPDEFAIQFMKCSNCRHILCDDCIRKGGDHQPPHCILCNGELHLPDIRAILAGTDPRPIVDYTILPGLDNAQAYDNKAYKLAANGYYEKALVNFDQAIRFAPDRALTYFHKGMCLRKLNRHEEALIAFERAARLDPGNSQYHFDRGCVLLTLGLDEKAIAAFDEGIHADPYAVSNYINKGHTLNKLERYTEGLVVLEHASRLEPGNDYAHSNKAVSLYGLGRYDEALSDLEKALSKRPDIEDYELKEAALKKLGRHQEAQEAYQKAHELRNKKD